MILKIRNNLVWSIKFKRKMIVETIIGDSRMTDFESSLFLLMSKEKIILHYCNSEPEKGSCSTVTGEEYCEN